MTFTQAVRTCLAKYADFGGRAGRPEFWWFTLFTVLGSLLCGLVSTPLAIIFTLATLIPSVAVATRRLHDTGKSGWMQLIGLIPLIGWIVLLVWLAQAPRDPA